MEKISLFVPGRICLFGEHSDWAGSARTMNAAIVPGRAIVTGTEQGIYGVAEKSEKFIVESSIEDYKGESFECVMERDALRETAKAGGFFSYVAGVASYICEWYRVGGVRLNITRMDLPMKSGLSSSAAICVMVARAFNELYDLRMNTGGIMNIAYLGEQRTPSRCGRLDQACAYGRKAVLMEFDGNEVDSEPIPVKKSLHYVIADLMAGKDTVKILADLSKGYPFAHNETEEKEHEALGEDNERIVNLAKEYISNGEVKKLGELMTEAQHIFDEKIAPMCPEELAAPVLHSVINDPTIKELSYGVKGIGSQGDGTVQILAKDNTSKAKIIKYLSEERKMTAYGLTVQSNGPVRKAVIPVAGFGTRLYPETRGIKKEFCPVIDRDGLFKPAIMILLEELDALNIEQICLVINREEEQFYRDFFFKRISEAHYEKLPDSVKPYENLIERISKKLSFVYQDEQKGFGHAVYQTARFAAGEPVLLLLGDTLYKSFTDKSCTAQLLSAFKKYGKPMVAVHRVELPEVVHYGIFCGNWENTEQNVMILSKIAEKPDVDTAKDFLNVPTKENNEGYYAAFGCYVLTKDIYDRLETAVDKNITNSKGEVELTDALEYVRKNSGLMAFVPEGESYDIGNVEAYRKTLSEFDKDI